jgi:hypothetical protein
MYGHFLPLLYNTPGNYKANLKPDCFKIFLYFTVLKKEETPLTTKQMISYRR